LKPPAVGRRELSRAGGQKYPIQAQDDLCDLHRRDARKGLALTDPDLSPKYFHGSRIEIEPRVGGNFVNRFPDGRVNVRGEVVE
jgi:hypothetical protein